MVQCTYRMNQDQANILIVMVILVVCPPAHLTNGFGLVSIILLDHVAIASTVDPFFNSTLAK